MADRRWSYRGHVAELREMTHDGHTIHVVLVDGRKVDAELTEPKAAGKAYAAIDRLAEDEALRPQLQRIADARYGLEGQHLDPQRDRIGDTAWIEAEGVWRRGRVTWIGRTRAEVAWSKGPGTPGLWRTRRRFENVVMG